jgi:acyl carrier protein
MSAEVKRVLKDFILERFMYRHRGDDLADDFDLLGSGVLDSLGAFTLVFHIEETFGIEVPPQDVTIEDFSTVATIAAYIARRTS